MFDTQYSFGKSSTERLLTCHKDLQMIMNYVIKFKDISILCGYRPEDLQNEYYNTGKSKVKYPNSKHNKFPSTAIDVCPFPVNWGRIDEFAELVRFIQGIALGKYNIKLRVGLDWNGNWKKDETFVDGPHIELHSKWDEETREWIKY